MKRILRPTLLALFCLALLSWSFKSPVNPTSYKCMVQLTNYQGEGAYLVISLIDPQGKYDQTLYMMGKDEKWYPDLEQWWKFYEVKKSSIDGISGASISGGQRSVCVLEFDDSKIDKGYKIRFESAVEDHEYYADDLEIPLTTENLSGKFEGKGYVRYVRLLPN